MNTLPSKTHITTFIALLFVCLCYGQQAVIPAGGNSTNGSGSVSYTIGEVGYTTTSNGTYSIAAGVQQPFEISVLSVDENLTDNQLKVFPNPTVNTLTLSIEDMAFDNLSYILFDTNGKVLSQQKITTQKTTIEFAHLPSSIYFIKVESQGKNVKTFKIIKK